MSFDKLMRGQVVTPSGTLVDGWIGVDGETIAAVGEGPAPAADVVHDFGEAWILPGGIDAQTHAGSYWGLPGLKLTSRGAICGGVTTMVEMPFDNPAPLASLREFDAKVAAVEALAYCDVALYGTLAPGQPVDEMYRLAEAGVCGFKISVCESHPVRFPRIAADQQYAMLRVAAELGLPLGIHNEDQEIVRAHTALMRATGRNTLAEHSASRPEAAELAATALFLELAALTGAHGHVVHISTPRGFDIVRRHRAAGHRATGEICAHYLVFDPAEDGERLAARMKVNPPIRAGARDALWDEVRLGNVECISSDHSTMPLANKDGGSVFDAGPGMPGIETLMQVFFTGADRRGLYAPAMVARHLGEKPAKLFGLWPRKGGIAVGADADLAVLSRRRFRYDAACAHDGVNWSNYHGMEFAVRVSSTFVRGKRVWDGETVCGRMGHGRFVGRP